MPRIAKIELLNERSEQVRDVLGRVPGWMTRWGITVVFFFILSLAALSWMIKYPDIVPARIVVTTPAPPAGIVAQVSGKLVKVVVKDNQQVRRNQLLAIIENPAQAEEVMQLASQLEGLKNAGVTELAQAEFSAQLRLGEIQRDYAEFLRYLEQYRFFSGAGALQREMSNLRAQQVHYSELIRKQQQQLANYQQEINLAEGDFARSQQLLNEKVIAIKDVEDQEGKLLQLKRACQSVEAGMINTRITLAELGRSLTALSTQQGEKSNQYELMLRESFKNLQGSIAGWEQKYILRAPIEGKVSFFKIWADHQFVTAGSEVMVVVPSKQGQVIGKVFMPMQNSGKVKPGQRVNIQLDNYPYHEYGMLTGEIKSISLVPRDNMYAIEVQLPADLVTTYHKKLIFKQEMQGSAEIITEDLRLIERIFYQLRNMMKMSN